jgi:hypothetical protein
LEGEKKFASSRIEPANAYKTSVGNAAGKTPFEKPGTWVVSAGVDLKEVCLM